MHRAWTHQNFGDKLLNEIFHRRVVTCFIDDRFGIGNRHKLNLDMVTWECDYRRTRPGRSHPNRAPSTECPTTRSTRSPVVLSASSRSTCSRTC